MKATLLSPLGDTIGFSPSSISMLGAPLPLILRNALRRVGLLSSAKQALSRINFELSSQAYGARVVVPSINGMRCDATEPFMLGVLRQAMSNRAGCMLDIGVNLGQTLVKVKAIDPARTYVGFEPNPSCVYYVGELIKANQFVGCTIVPVGLFTREDVLELLMIADTATDSAASLIDDLRPAESVRRVVHVPVMRYETISRYLRETVAVIKIDVEGAELEVLQTLAPLIERDRPILLVEILPAYSADNRPRMDRQDSIERMLAAWGYVIDRVLKDEHKDLKGLERVAGFGVHGDIDRCDYVLSPSA